ncbi:MAG: trans-2-enoyl-CoA reductase [Coxiella sp. RIFCSPHIGHO2_12_FULL_44_14]|nr:MAG: trans-2-enoyl-CoA reductase [Coxiella sp. RIFCSPHIGHO2_12_FULL_44_14]
MVIQPKVRGFICTTAHPIGCETHVREWIDYVKKHSLSTQGPKKVFIIGASTGFGLASRIVAGFGYGAQTIGVFFEKPASDKRTASAGWYNTAAYEKAAHAEGLYAKSINGDAFSDEIKNQVMDLVKKDWKGEIDLVIYSIASPRRIHPKSQAVYSSVLKPIGQSFKNKTVDVLTGQVSMIDISEANEDEIAHTVAVMGGEDWEMWLDRLIDEKLLAPKAKTVAFTYIGPELTHAIYRNGTIGKAKEHLELSAAHIKKKLQKTVGGDALISVNKALVTQASAAIPVVPLYISLLYKVMKHKNLHEGCVEQMWRLFSDRLYGCNMHLDEKGRIRIDDWEMRDDVQQEVEKLWHEVQTDNIKKIADLDGYLDDFYHLFGFHFPHVDYQKEVNPEVKIESIRE